jgi:hypothetical protein
VSALALASVSALESELDRLKAEAAAAAAEQTSARWAPAPVTASAWS